MGHIIHYLGFEGQNKWVGVMDGGFTQTNEMPFFDSLRIHGNLLPSKDMVHGDNYAYEDSSHGSQVLSTMGANLPGLMVGTAPSASYVCIKTEEMGAENPVEEEYWIRGLEYADSLGVDVVNSSLGYTSFDVRELNHEKEKLNGQTYRASLAATIAATKGILVVSSAGNEGNGSWKTIGVPADADLILTIGAVNNRGNKTNFSSVGPSADGRIKPEIVALGERSAVAHLKGYQVNGANGTSFSSPILAGMATSLWSAFPNKRNDKIRAAIINSGSQIMQPDSLLGYGIPDFTKAFAHLSGVVPYHQFDPATRIFKLNNDLQIIFPLGWNRDAKYIIYDAFGEVVLQGNQKQTSSLGFLDIDEYDSLPPNFYQILVISGDFVFRVHDVKLSK